MPRDIQSLALPGVQRLRPYQPGKPVDELERELGIEHAVKMASNENPLGPGQAAREAMAAATGGIEFYPDGNGFSLKKVLAKRHGVDAACLTLGNGSNDILELVARAFAGPGCEVVYAQHAFAVYPIVTLAVGATGVEVSARDWGHDLDAMLAAVNDRTRLVFIANPNNPTGTVLGAEELRTFVAAVPEHVIVVIDQAYFEYARGADYADCIGWLERFDRLLVTRTFSKAHGLAGLRVGYGVSSPQMADLLNRVRQPFNVNSIALAAAAAAAEDDAHVRASVELNDRGMAQLTAEFERLGLAYIPSAGNFVCVEVGGDAMAVYQALLHRGVIVRPIDVYGMPGHLRVTVGRERDNARFIEALQAAMNGDRDED